MTKKCGNSAECFCKEWGCESTGHTHMVDTPVITDLTTLCQEMLTFDFHVTFPFQGLPLTFVTNKNTLYRPSKESNRLGSRKNPERQGI